MVGIWVVSLVMMADKLVTVGVLFQGQCQSAPSQHNTDTLFLILWEEPPFLTEHFRFSVCTGYSRWPVIIYFHLSQVNLPVLQRLEG